MLTWNLHPTLDDALQTVRQQWNDLGLSKSPRTRPFSFVARKAEDVLRHNEGLAEPMSPEIVKLFTCVEGRTFSFSGSAQPSFFLWPLNEVRWLKPSDEMELSWLKEEYPDWYAAGFLAFGQGIFGDTLVWCKAPPHRTTGSIILLDHEGGGPENDANQPQGFIVLGDSLAQWLARWAACEFTEYAYVSGEIPNLSVEYQRTLYTDIHRLNPGMSWLQDRLDELGS